MNIDEQIKALLEQFGVFKTLDIEHEEDKPHILTALQQPDIESVTLDDENGLVITYLDNVNE